jgi:polyisoprenoid-binding protein YceI
MSPTKEQIMAITTHPFTGVWELDVEHSTVQFAVRHVSVSTFRASFANVDARLSVEGDALALEGHAAVESLSIVDPDFRAHVVRGTDFFDADTYPVIVFRSTNVELSDDGTAIVEGDLTIRGASLPVTAQGTYRPPTEDPFGAYRAGLALEATVDRRHWGLDWQLELPGGGEAVGWDVDIVVDLELVRKGS